ncbi:MAG: MoaD/ThiS family protein [Paracoccaceae bacterium]
MVAVRLWGSLGDLAGAHEVDIAATTLGELLRALETDYPALRPQLERGISVSIDGRIYNDLWATPIRADSEVVLLNRLVGG